MALRWYATAPIHFDLVLAFNIGDHVPDSVVAAHPAETTGRVTRIDVPAQNPAVVLRPLLTSDRDTDAEREAFVPARLSDVALRAALVPFWTAAESVAAGVFRLAPDGTIIQRNSAGTTRSSYDATEAALWTVKTGAGGGSTLVPTATKTAAYTVAVGELAVMNVAAGATALTLPTAPADKAQVGFRAVGATTATPLVVTRGGTDTIGDSGATSVSLPLAGEVTVYQYQASGTRWLPVSNVKPLTALDARYDAAGASTAAVNGVLVGFVQGGATVLRSFEAFLSADTSFSFPSRIRPVETTRRLVRVHNIGVNALQLVYGTGDNGNFNNPSWTSAYTVNPGQEWVDTSGNSRALFLREATNGSPVLYTVYTESAVA